MRKYWRGRHVVISQKIVDDVKSLNTSESFFRFLIHYPIPNPLIMWITLLAMSAGKHDL